MKYITPTNSKLKIIVDDDCYGLLNRHNWYISDTGYAMTQLRGDKHIRMHHIISGKCSNKKLVVDHLNRNKLDNRYRNLRWTTQANNANNRDVVGYCWDDSRKSYMVKYKGKFYGRYKTAREAERVYQLAKSGIEYKPKTRQKYMLPKNIYRQSNKWGYGFSINGKRYRKNGYATMSEAEDGLRVARNEALTS